MEQVLVYGASGHGKVVADAAQAMGFELIGFVDDDPDKRGEILLGLAVVAIGFDEIADLCNQKRYSLAMGIGQNAARKKVFERLKKAGLDVVTVVHPQAVIAQSATLGPGTVAFGGVVVNPDTVVGDNVILNTGCTIDHDNRIGSHAHISPGAHLGGTVVVGEGTHVGIGSSVKNNINIGSWSVIGAGAAVVRDLPDRVVAVGVPARILREIPG